MAFSVVARRIGDAHCGGSKKQLQPITAAGGDETPAPAAATGLHKGRETPDNIEDSINRAERRFS
jgi:hypothetical protein